MFRANMHRTLAYLNSANPVPFSITTRPHTPSLARVMPTTLSDIFEQFRIAPI